MAVTNKNSSSLFLDYISRKEAAAKICKLYPGSPIKRAEFAKSNLVEKNCKFVILAVK